MPSVLFVNQFYAPDLASTGQHLTDLAEHVAAKGVDVSVLCSSGRYEGGRASAPKHEVRGGVTVTRLRSWSPGKRSLFLRVIDAMTLQGRFLWRVLRSRADVVVTLTTPPMICVAGALRRRVRGGRHVCFVMDLHPDVEFELGVVSRRSLLGRFLEAVHRWALRDADSCVVLGETMRSRLLEKGIVDERIVTIPVWNDRNEVYPIDHSENSIRDAKGWQGRFVVLYSGNTGLAHTFDDVIAAARELNDEAPDVLFAFVGGGARRAEIAHAAEESRLTNVEFHEYAPREQLRESLGSADVHLITLRDNMAGLAAPSKLYAAMASARPVLFVGPDPSEPTEGIDASGCGFRLPIGDARGLADKIRSLRASPDLRRELGERGLLFFLTRHERRVCCDAWSELLESCFADNEAPRITPIPFPDLPPLSATIDATTETTTSGDATRGASQTTSTLMTREVAP